ncbi:MAG: translation elongation factor Ts [Candidatus Izemoplasmatales bacterium]|jgi:elongation factor Ts
MNITAALVKELRDKTGAGMMDCKKALVAVDGNIDQAIDWLREKGIAKAQKKASRIAAEGVCDIKISGDKALMFELNCETDFVAKNEKFTALVDKIGKRILDSDASSVEKALELEIEGKTIETIILEAVSNIGENINLRRMSVTKKKPSETFGSYIHMGGKIASLSVVKNGDYETAKDVAMQVAASSPQYLTSADISLDFIAKEREILTKEALNENKESPKPKPEAIIAKMVEGRLQKNLKDICLVNQPFIKNPDQQVGEYVKAKGAEITMFQRMAVGEGIEKKEENFVDEVMSQTRQ